MRFIRIRQVRKKPLKRRIYSGSYHILFEPDPEFNLNTINFFKFGIK